VARTADSGHPAGRRCSITVIGERSEEANLG
jgi:hypothetical protein